MMRRYGTTQVCEYRLTQAEVDQLVISNAVSRLNPSYDFDYQNPVLLKEGHDYIIRFVQRVVNQDGEAKRCDFKPFEQVR